MEEIWALQALFEQTQAAETVQRLSERNCIEIILKLIESGRSKLMFSSTGKEFLTPGRLRSEVLSEVQSHGGRISITDLPDLLNVDLVHIEKSANELSFRSSMSLVNGQIISKAYIDRMCFEIVESVLESGMVTLAALSQQFSFPVGLIQTELETRLQFLGDKLNCQLNLQNQKLYTDFYSTTHNAKIQGLLLGCTRPVSMQSLLSGHGLQEKLLSQLLHDKRESFPGTVPSGTNSLGGTFSPWVYIRAQKEHISAMYTQNSFVELNKLSGTGLSKPSQYLQELFPDGTLLLHIFINPVLLQAVDVAIAEAVASSTWLDARTVLPPSLSTDEVSSIIKKAAELPSVKKVSKQYHHIEKVYVVSNAFIQLCSASLDPCIIEAGTHAALVMHQKGKQITVVSSTSKDPKSKSGRSKKRFDDTLSNHIRPSLELNVVKQNLSTLFPDCDTALITAISTRLMPTLRTQFEKIRDSPHIINDELHSGVDVSNLRRNRIKHWIQNILSLAESFQAFSAANAELSCLIDDVSVLEQHLVSTIGLELSNALLVLAVYLNCRDFVEEDYSSLNDERRHQLLSMLPAKSSQLIAALNLCKSSTEFFAQFKALAAENDVQIKEVQKKKIKQIVFSMKTQLAQKVSKEERPEAILLLAIILLFYRVIGMILHAPFSSVDTLLLALPEEKIAKESIDQLKALKEEIASPTDNLNSVIQSVRGILTSEPKLQENT